MEDAPLPVQVSGLGALPVATALLPSPNLGIGATPVALGLVDSIGALVDDVASVHLGGAPPVDLDSVPLAIPPSVASGGVPGADSISKPAEDHRGKLFIGGLSWETTVDGLRKYFETFGEVTDCVVMSNAHTGRSRGFGFITFSDPLIAKHVIENGPHNLDNRTIDPKPAVPKGGSNAPNSRTGKTRGRKQQNHGNGNAAPVKTKKIFVGGLAPESTEEALKTFFGEFGTVEDVILMYDRETKRPRGFGFVTFTAEEPVEKLVAKRYVQLDSKQVEIKAALPKASMAEGGRGRNTRNTASNNSGRGGGGGQGSSSTQFQYPYAGFPQGYGRNQGYQQAAYAYGAQAQYGGGGGGGSGGSGGSGGERGAQGQQGQPNPYHAQQYAYAYNARANGYQMDSTGTMQQYQQQAGQQAGQEGSAPPTSQAGGSQNQEFFQQVYHNMMQQGGQQGQQGQPQNYYSTYQGYPQQGGGRTGQQGQQGYQQYAAMSQAGGYPQPGQEGEYDSRGFQQQYHGDYGAQSAAGGADTDAFDALPGAPGHVDRTVPGGANVIGSPISSRVASAVVAPGDILPDLSGPPLDAAPISKSGPSSDAYGAPY